MECFRLLFEHLAWIDHQFLSNIRDSRKAGSLWRMMRGVGGVRTSIYQNWLAKGLALGSFVEVLREFRKTFIGKKLALFKSGLWHFHQDNAPVHNSILFTDYLTEMGIKRVPQPPYSRDLAPCDFWLFPKLTGYRYETIEMKEVVTKVIDKRTSMGPCRNCWSGTTSALQPEEITSKGTRVCTINKSAHTKKSLETYFMILVVQCVNHCTIETLSYSYQIQIIYAQLYGFE